MNTVLVMLLCALSPSHLKSAWDHQETADHHQVTTCLAWISDFELCIHSRQCDWKNQEMPEECAGASMNSPILLVKGHVFWNWIFPQICCDFPKIMFCNILKLLHSNCCYYYGLQMKFWPFICWEGLISTHSFRKESQFWAPWKTPSSRYHNLKQTGRLRTEL